MIKLDYKLLDNKTSEIIHEDTLYNEETKDTKELVLELEKIFNLKKSTLVDNATLVIDGPFIEIYYYTFKEEDMVLAYTILY